MDYYDRIGYGRDTAPPRRSSAEYPYYLGREHEVDPYGSRMEGRDLLSGGRDRQLDPYGPRMDGQDLISSGRDRDLDSYRPAKMEGLDLLPLSSVRERELDSHRAPRMEGLDMLSSGREGELDSYRSTRVERRDLLSSAKERKFDPYRPLRTEERDSYRPFLEGRYADHDREHDIHAGWRERDSLVGGRDFLRNKTINGSGGMHPTDFGRTELGIGSGRFRADNLDDPALMVTGSRFDKDLGSRFDKDLGSRFDKDLGSRFDKDLDSMREPLGRNGLGRDNEPMRGAADSPSEPVLFVDGFPLDCTRREAAHIFRPFIGFKEVRIVHKEPKKAGGEKVVLCFVEFTQGKHAAVALDAIQGYKFDEHDPNSPKLQISFSLYSSNKGSGRRKESRGGPDSERGRRTRSERQ